MVARDFPSGKDGVEGLACGVQQREGGDRSNVQQRVGRLMIKIAHQQTFSKCDTTGTLVEQALLFAKTVITSRQGNVCSGPTPTNAMCSFCGGKDAATLALLLKADNHCRG